MVYARPLRLPLATGASVIQALSVPVGIFQLIAFGPLFLPLPDWVVYPVGILWAAWFFAVIGSVVQGVRRRASDVLLSTEGLAVRGGPARGLSVRWEELDPARCEVRTTAREDGTIHTLILDGREAAVTEDEAELRSFQAIVDTVRAVCGGGEEAAGRAPRRLPPDVITCDACGAPAILRDEEEVPCRHCGARVRVPEERRKQIRSLGTLEGARLRSEKLLRVLLRQRGAGYVNALALVATPPLVLGGPLAAIVFNELYVTRHVFRGIHGVAIFVCGLTFTYGLSLLVRGELVGRAALRLVALSFHAAPPAREGDPPECRVCGAPLADGPEKVVVICAYCRAENITDIDLRPRADVAVEQASGLLATLDERLRTRRRYRVLSVVSVALLATCAITMQRTFFGPCRDGVRDGDETDVDCGGSCTRCLPAQACREGEDCRSHICEGGACAAPRCDDGVRNGGETDVDCGGECSPCPLGKNCDASAHNCASGRCGLGGKCE